MSVSVRYLSLLALPVLASTVAHADTFQVSAAAAGVQTAAGITTYTETFNNALLTGGAYVTNFSGSTITGTYTGAGLAIENAGTYGGAGGSGKYISAVSSGTYTLTLSTAVNYFGLWDSALDSGNQLSFYNGSTLLYTFTPAAFQKLVGACPSTTSGYCGNPNIASSNNDSGEQFAYLNFFDSNGSFNKIVFSQTSTGGEFESDNHAVANISTAPGGLIITPIPEPSTMALLGTGLCGGFGLLTRRRR